MIARHDDDDQAEETLEAEDEGNGAGEAWIRPAACPMTVRTSRPRPRPPAGAAFAPTLDWTRTCSSNKTTDAKQASQKPPPVKLQQATRVSGGLACRTARNRPRQPSRPSRQAGAPCRSRSGADNRQQPETGHEHRQRDQQQRPTHVLQALNSVPARRRRRPETSRLIPVTSSRPRSTMAERRRRSGVSRGADQCQRVSGRAPAQADDWGEAPATGSAAAHAITPMAWASALSRHRLCR